MFDVPSDHRHLRPNLSSWVPNWSDEGWRAAGGADARIAVTRDRFCAAGPADPKWSFSHDQRRLIVSGKIIDSVIYCAEPLNIDMRVMAGQMPQTRLIQTPVVSQSTRQDALSMSQSAFQTLNGWAEVASWYGEYPTGETVEQALLRTLISDTPPQTPHEKLGTNSWYKIMTASDNDRVMSVYRLQQRGLLGPGIPTPAELQAIAAQVPQASLMAFESDREASKYNSQVWAFANRRALFTTEEGYMGTAPARITETGAENLIEAGDRIAIVAGLEMPVVLRPIESEDQGNMVYQYVTHVYVHGMMYGEAWEDENHALEEIVLI
jgi:hypothetical protein